MREEFTGPTHCACGRELGFFIRSLGQDECWTCTQRKRARERLPRTQQIRPLHRPPTVDRGGPPEAA